MSDRLPSQNSRGPALSTLLVILAATIWGGSVVFAKHIYIGYGLAPIHLVSARAYITFLGLAVGLALYDRRLFRVSLRDLPYFLILGVIGLALLNYLYYFAISRIPVGTAVLIQYTMPVMVMAYSILARREPFTITRLIALILTLLGVGLLLRAWEIGISGLDPIGVGASALAALTFSFYILFSEVGLKRYSPTTLLLYSYIFASLFWLTTSRPVSVIEQIYQGGALWMVILFGVAGTLLPFLLFLAGISGIRAQGAAIAATFEVLSAAAFSWVFLSERLGAVQILGGVAILIGILLVPLTRK